MNVSHAPPMQCNPCTGSPAAGAPAARKDMPLASSPTSGAHRVQPSEAGSAAHRERVGFDRVVQGPSMAAPVHCQAGSVGSPRSHLGHRVGVQHRHLAPAAHRAGCAAVGRAVTMCSTAGGVQPRRQH